MSIPQQVWQDLSQLIEEQASVASALDDTPVEQIRREIYGKLLQESFREVSEGPIRHRLAIAYRILRRKSIP